MQKKVCFSDGANSQAGRHTSMQSQIASGMRLGSFLSRMRVACQIAVNKSCGTMRELTLLLHGQVLESQAEATQLQQKLSDMDSLLRSFKHQNDRFADTKGRYETDMRKLAAQLQDKSDENNMLLRMCDQLMTELEKRGIAVPPPM